MLKKFIFIVSIFIINSSLYSQEIADTKYWIIFKDKGEFTSDMIIEKGSLAYEKGKELLTERAINRRLKVLSENNLIDFKDLPLNAEYVSGVKNLNIELIAQSKWLNGVSAYMTNSQLEKVKSLDFVTQIKAVNKLYKQFTSNPGKNKNENLSKN